MSRDIVRTRRVKDLGFDGPVLTHNLDPCAFMWLWAKYVTDYNPGRHCTQAIRGRYSRILSAHNDKLRATPRLCLDEQPVGTYAAIYICGVARGGYSSKKNYPHNLHAAIRPCMGASDKFVFEGWKLGVENGVFLPIPSIEDLPEEFSGLEDSFTTCRIFRWAVVAKPKGSDLLLAGS